MTKRAAEDQQEIKIVVTDIEGTTTPISFVHDCLFPYVTRNLDEFLKERENDAELDKILETLKEQADKDITAEFAGVEAILPLDGEDKQAVRDSIAKNIRWQMSQDRKIGPLKSFQGYMWKFAYEQGKVKGVVFDDVEPVLEDLQSKGIDMYVYSSGRIFAQKLLFGYSEKGDLLKYFKGHFDTGIGSKLEAKSYTNIAESIAGPASSILFLSDNVKEIDAAIEAGFQTAVVFRDGNAPLDPEAKEIDGSLKVLRPSGQVPVIHSFKELLDRKEEFVFAEPTTNTPKKVKIQEPEHETAENGNGESKESEDAPAAETATPSKKIAKSPKSPRKERKAADPSTPARMTRSRSRAESEAN
ncbi:hypothetical protein HDU76_000226 [Blyttiomyces sp. JEL0837]|nr:hypothetical protein HDU76_000226 [Blyttiomyces sp. JEL0837]